MRNERNSHVKRFNDSLPSDPKRQELCGISLSLAHLRGVAVDCVVLTCFASEWLGRCSMSTLTKTYLDIFRNFFPREYPSTNNIVIFLRFHYVRLRDRLPVDPSKRFISFVDLVRSAASTDYDLLVPLLESHPGAGRGPPHLFLHIIFVFAPHESPPPFGTLSSYWGPPGSWKLECC